MNKTVPALIVFLLTAFSCARLDDNLYNPNTVKISEYKFDGYQGEVDFRLDTSYKIPSSKIHLVELYSKNNLGIEAVKLYGVYIGDISAIATDTVIMYCHGNRDHMDFYWQRAKLLANAGGKNRYGVFMIDYRGYGLSDGEPSEEGLYQDVDGALAWLKEKGLTNNRLAIYGFSLGSAPATKLCASPRTMRPGWLLLESPFASAEVMVQDASGLALPGEFFTDLKIDNAEEIKNVHQPFFWTHGKNDDFLSITTHGEQVFKNYGGVFCEAHRVNGAGHSDVPQKSGFQNYMNSIATFLQNH